LPRDRFIFNYDYFNNAALTPNGIDVNRFAFGFEKTFFNGNTSIEVRLPVAGTLDSSGVIGAQSRDTVLGNLRITPRALLYRSDTFAVGTGLGIALPTADDTRVANFDGSDLVRINNDRHSLAVSRDLVDAGRPFLCPGVARLRYRYRRQPRFRQSRR